MTNVSLIREYRFLISLLMTIVVETALLAALLLPGSKKKEDGCLPPGLVVFSGISASMATLPYVWFIFPLFFRSRLPYLAAAEGFAVLGEAVFYYFSLKIHIDKALLFSFLCNAASFLSGLILNRLLYY